MSTKTMVVVEWSEKVKGSGENINALSYEGLYKEDDSSIFPWSGTDSDSKMNCFTLYRYYNYCIVPGYK